MLGHAANREPAPNTALQATIDRVTILTVEQAMRVAAIRASLARGLLLLLAHVRRGDRG